MVVYNFLTFRDQSLFTGRGLVHFGFRLHKCFMNPPLKCPFSFLVPSFVGHKQLYVKKWISTNWSLIILSLISRIWLLKWIFSSFHSIKVVALVPYNHIYSQFHLEGKIKEVWGKYWCILIFLISIKHDFT